MGGTAGDTRLSRGRDGGAGMRAGISLCNGADDAICIGRGRNLSMHAISLDITVQG